MRGFRVVGTIGAVVAAVLAINVAAAGAFTWTPASLNFGKGTVGKKSKAKTVTVTAQCGPDIDGSPLPGFQPAPGPCTAADIAISGQFLISSTTCPPTGITLPTHGQTCTIDVRFKPRSKGKQKGFLRIRSNPFGGVPLEGRGCKKQGGQLSCKKG